MWLGKMKIFRTMLCTLCQNCPFIFNMQLCGLSTALMGTVFCILVIFSHVFLSIIATTVCSTGSSCGQQVPNVIRCHGKLVNSIKNSLNTKRSLHSRLNFHVFWFPLLIFLWLVMTCVIPQPNGIFFSLFSNASHSMHCSSVEAYLLWKCCSVSHRIVFNIFWVC